MCPLPVGDYSRWRACAQLASSFRESGDRSAPSERLLQAIWRQQRILTDRLRTFDGRSVRVLHPGFWNRAAGPDFRGAIIQFGDALAKSGDIEIDLRSNGWFAHHHDENPNYKSVILHVVWEPETGTDDLLPTVALQPVLDAPLPALECCLDLGTSTLFESGRCSSPLADLSEERVGAILDQAAGVRLRAKAAQYESRARQVGWDRSLWEGLFGALGYKQNYWPMRRLAELTPAFSLSMPAPATALDYQARLLGVAGLLPNQMAGMRASSCRYLRKIWDRWWRDREQFSELILPKELWCLHGLRPANHPQRRLALAAHWLASGTLIPRLEKWFLQESSAQDLSKSLLETLGFEQDEFWSWHWTLRSARMKSPHPLLGPQRATDLVMNVVIPWIWSRAAAGNEMKLQALVETRYLSWPKGEDNSVLRQARLRMFGSQRAAAIRSAARQQGLLQIVRDFCNQSNALCENCQFPDLAAGG